MKKESYQNIDDLNIRFFGYLYHNGAIGKYVIYRSKIDEPCSNRVECDDWFLVDTDKKEYILIAKCDGDNGVEKQVSDGDLLEIISEDGIKSLFEIIKQYSIT